MEIKFSDQPVGTPTALDFNPATDVFSIDDAGLSAASFTVTSPTLNTTKFEGGGKSITLKTAISKLYSGNVAFADHSVLRIGDEDHNDTANGGLASTDGLTNLLPGTTHDDQLWGLAGNDSLNGGAGADVMVGGTGGDTYTVDNTGDQVIELDQPGLDKVKSLLLAYTLGDFVENLALAGSGDIDGTGNGLANTLEGNIGANELRGVDGDDRLIGKAGNDYLDGGAGADTLIGGDGGDQYVVDDAGDVIKETTSSDVDSVSSTVSYTLAPHVDNLTLAGSDAIDGTGNGISNTITGNNKMNALLGRGGDDHLIGSGGADLLDGGIGADIMEGGTGSDRYMVDDSMDGVTELDAQGTDVVTSTAATYTLTDFVENLVLGTGGANGTGNGGANKITGNAAANYLDGGAGVDTLTGGGGDDTYLVDDANDSIKELAAEGYDTAISFVTYTLPANVEQLSLANDLVIDGTGNTGDNVLNGSNGSNHLYGMGGNDQIYGNGGGDVMLGGGGDDAINFLDGDQARGGAGEDQVIANVAALDLTTAIAGDGLSGFEEIYLGWYSGTAVSLTAGDALELSDTDTLRIRGTGSVNTTEGLWLQGADVVMDLGGGDETLSQYTHDGATLLIGAGVDTSGIELIPSTFALSSLDGDNGFRLDGIYSDDRSGASVGSAGDINGDGYDDLMVGAPLADPGGVANDQAGQSYLVLGSGSFGSAVDLFLEGANDGFRIDDYQTLDESGYSVSGAGDMNGDGFADIMVSAPFADPAGRSASGETFVIYGTSSSFGDLVALSNVGGTTGGFHLAGATAGDKSGYSVAALGDMNGDGYDDVVVGAVGAYAGAGAAYVIFGGSGSSLNLGTLGGLGFHFSGDASGDLAGRSVASAGDFNNDGYDDLIVGAPNADPHGSNSGAAYVLFGHSGVFGDLSPGDLDGGNGFIAFEGSAVDGEAGLSVSGAGDVNADGYDDVIVGSYDGGSYVVFGHASGFGSLAASSLNGSNGFHVTTSATGSLVAGIGDVNGDGIDDLAVSGGSTDAYVIFGGKTFAADLSTSALNGLNGFRLEGEAGQPWSAVSAAGDVNGDGFADLVIGARDGNPVGHSDPGPYSTNAGQSWVFFGGDFADAVAFVGDASANTPTGTSADEAFVGGDGNDTMTGGGGADAFHGGRGNDTIVLGGGGALRVDGGAGTDTVNIDALGSLRLEGNPWSSIERIDLSGSVPTSLAVTQLGLMKVTASANTLVVRGDTGDLVTLQGVWGNHGTVSNPVGETGSFTWLSRGDAEIYVENDITLFTGVIQASDLDSTNSFGFVLHGASFNDYSGRSVAGAGDVNGDGFEDFLIGAPADSGSPGLGPDAWLVLGKSAAFAPDSTLGSANAIQFTTSSTSDLTGFSVAGAGDVNNDGRADFIVGAPGVNGEAGQSYVVFGQSSFATSVDLDGLNGTTGFKIAGSAGGTHSGHSVGSGDFNGDGFSDLIVGEPDNAGGNSYVIFGKASGFDSSLALSSLDGTDGFVLFGGSGNSGLSVASAGDLNGDGIDDFVIGAPNAGNGQASVVFGQSSFASSMELSALDGSDGFTLIGDTASDKAGFSVAAAGDVNGDGIGDLIVGEPDAGYNSPGYTYVVFGDGAGFDSSIELSSMDGTNGFRMTAQPAYSDAGSSVASAGDFNGDGYDDLIIGGPDGSFSGSANGSVFVVFGHGGAFASSLEMVTNNPLDGFGGLRLDGPTDIGLFVHAGASVASAGDINGDGYDDLVIGAPEGGSLAGHEGDSYVIYGRAVDGAVDFQGGGGNDSFAGGAADEAFVGGAGDDTLVGAGGADAFSGGAGSDVIAVNDLSFVRVDGGTGEDTLRLDGAGLTFNFNVVGSESVRDIEGIDLHGGGNTLGLDLQDVVRLSETTNQLQVDGAGGDTLELVGGWTLDHTAGGYEYYTLDGATVKVALAVEVQFPE